MKQTNKPTKEHAFDMPDNMPLKNFDLVTKDGTCLEQKRPKLDIDPKSAKKRAFIQAYRDSLFNVSAACRAAGLNRKTFYRWKDADPNFLEDLKSAEEDLKDYLRAKLLQLVDDGNLIATIFANKTIGKMVETTRQDITLSKGIDFSQEQLDAMVRGQLVDREKYDKMLGL